MNTPRLLLRLLLDRRLPITNGLLALSLRAVWLDPLPAEGLLQLHRARSFEEFRAELGKWPLLPLNVAYADQSGSIGWQLTGNAPRRRKGFGAVPLAGWDEEAGWEADLVPAAVCRKPEDRFCRHRQQQGVRRRRRSLSHSRLARRLSGRADRRGIAGAERLGPGRLVPSPFE